MQPFSTPALDGIGPTAARGGGPFLLCLAGMLPGVGLCLSGVQTAPLAQVVLAGLALGQPHAFMLDARQSEEIVLTAA